MKMDLLHGDCLELLPFIPDQSVDLVLADPPYGTTACKWDSIIPLEPMWEQLKRVAKPNAAIVMTASQPFTTTLIASNMKMFKYCWVWQKTLGANFAQVKKMPFKKHEDVVVFYTKQPTYNPQMEEGKAYVDKRSGGSVKRESSVDKASRVPIDNKGTRYPGSVQCSSNGNNGNVHPTQKPIPLIEYLIKTYSQPGNVVLDFTMGSGTTGVAAQNLNREFIGMELDPFPALRG
jgi:DNA modification methylase